MKSMPVGCYSTTTLKEEEQPKDFVGNEINWNEHINVK